MKKTITIMAMTAALLMSTTSDARAGGQRADHRSGGHNKQANVARELAELRRATAGYRRLSNALDNGYEAFAIPPEVGGTPTAGLGLVGDPTCFDDAAGGMGVHYVKGIDGDVNANDPEAVVYEITAGGRLKLVGVEYIVPDNLVDPADPPILFGQEFHHHPYLPVYILHVWAWKYNPSGLFADFNPRVSACPAPVPSAST